MKRKALLVVVCVILLVLMTSLYVAAQGPTITIYEPIDGAEVQAPTITLWAEVESPEGHPLEHLEVLVNGFPVLWKDKGVDPVLPGEIHIDIQLEEGENPIAVIAANDLGSTEQVITVTYTPSRVQRSNLYILAVGIADYEWDRVAGLQDLRYADVDAQDIVDAFSTQEGPFFGKVEAHLLLNKEATRANILNGMEWIRRETTQNDLAIIFVSGHGIRHESGDYYFLPHDGDLERIPSTAILWVEFEHRLKILPGKTALFVDTCHAGGVTGVGIKGGAAPNLEAIRDFAIAGRGAMVMTSSMEPELSWEEETWGHGAFTKAILDGLAGGADNDGNGIIYTTELSDYVTNRVKELTGGAQHPTTATSTEYTSFPLFVLFTPRPTLSGKPTITATPKAVAMDTLTPDAAATEIAIAQSVIATLTAQASMPTDTPVPPTNTPTCIPDSAFVTDVTVPDNTVFEPGEQFDKVWRLRNSGSCPWDEGYKLAFVYGDQMGAPASQPVSAAAPGDTADIGVTMQAPQVDGTYAGYWQMQDSSGQPLGQKVTVVIVVQTALPMPTDTPALPTFTSTPTNTPPVYYNAPKLLNPHDWAEFNSNDEIKLEWESVGELGPNEYYKLVFYVPWSSGREKYGSVWGQASVFSLLTKDTYSVKPPSADRWPESSWSMENAWYIWDVRVVQVYADGDIKNMSKASERRHFYWGLPLQ